MSTPVRQGEILAGKYRVDRVLGVGGMGVVVAAHHIELDQRVALKFLLPETLNNEDAVARFAREARAAVKIKSEHVARVSDVGRLENGAPYIVMEYLEGSDLSAWLSDRGALSVEQAVEFVLQACEAIAEAHALGIVHRDLKPANLFVIRRPDGVLSVKVLDFGISKLTNLTGPGDEASMTKTSALIGSPQYMSPEQMQSSKDVDARGDIWALGVILYVLVAGSVPFVGSSLPELVLQVVNASPAPLRSRRPDAPDGFEAVIMKCLEKDRGRRFQTVGDLAAALLPFGPKRAKTSVERISGIMKAAGLEGGSLALPPSSGSPEPVAGGGTAASWGRTTVPRRGQSLAFVGGLGVLLAVAVGVALRFGATDRVAPSVEVEPNPATAKAAPPTGELLAPQPMPSPESSVAPTAPAPEASTGPSVMPVGAASEDVSARTIPAGLHDEATGKPDSRGKRPPPPAARSTAPPLPAMAKAPRPSTGRPELRSGSTQPAEPTAHPAAPPPTAAPKGGTIFDDRK